MTELIDNISDLILEEEFFFVGKRTTVCLLTLKNGFEIVASSACLDPKNFNKETGKAISRELALQKLFEYVCVKMAMEKKND